MLVLICDRVQTNEELMNTTLFVRGCRGYLLTQVAGGVWADKFGGKKVLGFGVVWWSAATVLTPLAAGLGLAPLLLARACMGVGEGVAMPAMNNLLSRWRTPGFT